MDLYETFEKHQSEYLHFERIPNPPSNRPDLCAFLLLDRLCPGKRDVVGVADHDVIWLSFEIEDFAKVATEADVMYLRRCGVLYDPGVDRLSMFV